MKKRNPLLMIDMIKRKYYKKRHGRNCVTVTIIVQVDRKSEKFFNRP